MKLRTRKESFGFIGNSETQVNVLHSVKQTYKGAKIARVQNLTDEIQASAIDRSLHWERNKEQRRNRRKGIN